MQRGGGYSVRGCARPSPGADLLNVVHHRRLKGRE
jgi:hypothetical protein